jgi:hypothetical protein
MKGILFCAVLGGAGAILLLDGQAQDTREPVDFREVMIPMRDGVRLQTVILSPRGSTGHYRFSSSARPTAFPPGNPWPAAYPPACAPATKIIS